MEIHNLRIGFATNSSSTHSIIVADKKYRDKLVEDGFGWQVFVAASKKAKRLYLALTLESAFYFIVKDTDIARDLTKKYTGVTIGDHDYIDHQSMIALPLTWNEKFVDMEFFSDLSDYILQDNIVIVGGNDNEIGESAMPVKGHLSPLPFYELTDRSKQGLVARKDPVFGSWTLFNRNTGTKIRFSF